MTDSPSTSKSSFYERVDESQREVLLEAYLEYLARRNGPLDKGTGTLPKREARLQEMNAAAAAMPIGGDISQSDFDRLYAGWRESADELTPELLLLLTLCKMNAGEAYGVRIVRAVHERRHKGQPDLRERVIEFAQEEEEYHTRILVGASHHFGVQARGAYYPKLALKVLIHSIAYAPQPLFHPILYGSEVAGVYVFNWTLNQIRSFVTGQPELQEALEQRLVDILIDEVGHVAFNRLAMGQPGLGLGRALAGQTVRGMTWITPELAAMGFDRSVEKEFASFDLCDLPEEVRRHGFYA
jgi:hypothetical protein